MELSDALDFVRQRHQGVLTTLRRDGRPQLSNIGYVAAEDGTVRISVTASRAKTKNLARDPRASLYVVGDSFWAYAVLDGTAALSDVARDPDDDVVSELVAMYQAIQGEHPDWAEYRQAMVDDARLVVRLQPDHAYGIVG